MAPRSKLLGWLAGLDHETGVGEARGGRVRDPATAAADAGQEHVGERSGKPVQAALAQARLAVTRRPVRRTSPQAPMSMDTGTGSALGWINLTTRDSSGASRRSLVLPFTLR
ncbi:MAG: hypothetical protein OXR82_11020 [Gammaproteobacteria bacterium]|nr:hypothetical protein [Gammaproteobacteria bacterium]MDE0258897.1 hypothetical protein [Gammaproteobacteria bacterium]